MALKISSTINPAGLLSTHLPREGVDIGETPDFWGDIEKLKGYLKPRAANQAEGLRTRPSPLLASAPRASEGGGGGRVPLFVLPTNIGASGTFYQPWTPGMPTAPGQTPLAAGYLPYGYEPPKLPQSSYFQ